jgi:hypothetical protein
MPKTHHVTLTRSDREWLIEYIGRGSAPAREQTRARVLLKADEGLERPYWSRARIAGALELSSGCVANIRRRYADRGLEDCVRRKAPDREYKTKYKTKLDGEQESELIRLTYSESSEGRSQWVIPSEQSARFVAKMEDVLAVYRRPYDPARPVVCMDAMSRQLVKHVREPIGLRPGRAFREDHHYKRNGIVSLPDFFNPLMCWRTVMTRKRRTKNRLGRVHLYASGGALPDGGARRKSSWTPCLSSLYEAFSPAEAHSLAARLEIHYTPEHGSWLSVAETEQSVLIRRALSRRVPDRVSMTRLTASWARRRNQAKRAVDWQFTTTDVWLKLKLLKPNVDA